jgi:hypothetical protein
VYAVNADAALIMVAAARPGAEIIVAIPDNTMTFVLLVKGWLMGAS